MVRVKICCIRSREEAELAISHGASAIGLVSAMPSGPGVIEEGLIERIARHVPPGVSSFLLTSETEAARIIAQQRRCGTDTIQLCDRVSGGVREELRRALPGVRIVQVVHVTGRESLDEARDVAATVDAILLDSGRPDLSVKELGGTGRVHDWEVSRAIREAVTVPIFLAGGLGPANVRSAVEAVRPFGVDLCSGVRTDGNLDQEKLTRFMAELV